MIVKDSFSIILFMIMFTIINFCMFASLKFDLCYLIELYKTKSSHSEKEETVEK